MFKSNEKNKKTWSLSSDKILELFISKKDQVYDKIISDTLADFRGYILSAVIQKLIRLTATLLCLMWNRDGKCIKNGGSDGTCYETLAMTIHIEMQYATFSTNLCWKYSAHTCAMKKLLSLSVKYFIWEKDKNFW